MRNQKLQLITKIGILSAFAFLLYLFEFPLPFFPPFLQIDLGDLPAIVGSLALGPWVGVAIQLIKNILHVLLRSQTGGIGELGNFLTGSVFVITASLAYFKNKSRRSAIIGLSAATVLMSVAMGFFNFFVLIPAFTNQPVSLSLLPMIITSILPFNLLKGVILSGITLLLYKSLSPILHMEVYSETAEKTSK